MVTARPNIHNILILVLVSLICLASAADEDHHDEPHVRVLLGSLDKVEPEYGPRSGGTRVSLLGRHLLDPSKHDNVRVTLHEAGASYNCIVEDSSRSDRIVAITPGHKGVEDTVELRLDVFYSNDTEKGSYRSSFSYRPDPVVHEVHPNSVIAAGGVTLTVVGRNIDSVRTPVLASAVLRRGVTTRKPPNQQAYFVNSTCAKFRVPALTEQAYDITPEEAMDYKILVGFVFDGVQYLNHTFLEVEGNPVVQSWEPRVLNFSQDGDENIRVDVNWPPNSHISDDDISILIGTRKCLDLHRNGSQLICTPPSVPEPVILNGPESISKPTVTVRIGYLETYVGTIIYYLPGGIHIIILIMSAILAFMFLVALVFGCIALCSGRREAKKPTHKERSSISYVPVDDLDEMARRRSRVRLSKDSTVDIPLQFQRNRTSSDASTTSGRAPGEKGGDQPLHKIEELGEPQKGDTKIVFKDMLKENNNENKK